MTCPGQRRLVRILPTPSASIWRRFAKIAVDYAHWVLHRRIYEELEALCQRQLHTGIDPVRVSLRRGYRRPLPAPLDLRPPQNGQRGTPAGTIAAAGVNPL
jgi:hypothetical protein